MLKDTTPPLAVIDRRVALSLFASLLISAAVALPAAAQEVRVQNGATLQVQNGAVFGLQGGQMDLGSAGATATLNEQSAGRVTGGTLTVTRALSSPNGADPAGLGAVISASVDLGNVTVTRGHAVQDAPNGNEGIARYYDISPSQNNSGLSAELIFPYNDAELNGLSESNLELFRSNDGGQTWSEEGQDGRDAQNNTVTLSGIESFSRWTLGSEASPLPVELARFEATRVQSGGQEVARLTWQTVSEQSNAGFEVQRKAQDPSVGDAWQKVGFVESKAPGGTATEPTSYRFTDEDLPYAADTLSYRLRQVDIGGAATLSDPVAVARSGPSELQLKKTYPNPASGRVTVRYAVPEQTAAEETVRLRLYDVLGREVRSAALEAEAGRHERQLEVRDLASGTYFLRLRAGSHVRTQRLTVVK